MTRYGRQGELWHGDARSGKVRHGRFGMAGLGEVRRVWASSGKAGEARHGMVWLGGATHG